MVKLLISGEKRNTMTLNIYLNYNIKGELHYKRKIYVNICIEITCIGGEYPTKCHVLCI